MPPESWKWQLLGLIGHTHGVYQFKSWFNDGKDEEFCCNQRKKYVQL